MKISKEVKIAVISILAVLAFIVCINFLRGKSFLKTENTYYAVYPQIEGLVPSDPVKLNGLKIGSVSSIKFISETDTRIKVKMGVSKSVKIPTNSTFVIASANLMGGKYVNLILGDASTLLEDGVIANGDMEVDMFAGIADAVMPIKNKAENLIVSMDSIINNVNGILDANFAKNLDNSISNLNSTLSNMKKLSNNANNLLDGQKDNIATLVDNFKQLSEDLKKANVSGTTENLNKTITKLNTVLDSISNGNGSAALLIKDKKLYEELSASSDNLKKLLEDLQKNPKRYLHFSVF
ncbi:mammalian cell entry protein [Bacteroidia bacterium]|nr:mammalian cell entry protein [Bacteroidia bacterium]